MGSPPSSASQVDLVQNPTTAPPAPNSFAQSATVLVSVPEAVEVRLVDAGVLSDYEVWALVTSILSSAVVGFLVAFFQAPANGGGVFLAVTLVFGLLVAISGTTAFWKRRRLRCNTKQLRFRVGEQLSD